MQLPENYPAGSRTCRRTQNGAAIIEYVAITTFIAIIVWIAFIEGGSANGFSFPSVFDAAQFERDSYLQVIGEDIPGSDSDGGS